MSSRTEAITNAALSGLNSRRKFVAEPDGAMTFASTATEHKRQVGRLESLASSPHKSIPTDSLITAQGILKRIHDLATARNDKELLSCFLNVPGHGDEIRRIATEMLAGAAKRR